MPNRAKLLLIDDSQEIQLLTRKTLSDLCLVESAYTFTEGLKKFEEDHYQIVIIDLNLEGKDGMELLREFKSRPRETRFFIMTSKDSLNDELLGHTYGVDEYLKKPMNLDILRAIVQKNLKILQSVSSQKLQVGPLQLLPDQYKVFLVDGSHKSEIGLTVKEFQLLIKLASHPEKVFSREELFQQIWSNESDSTFRTIDMHVSSLRKKLGLHGALIRTVHQVGYELSS
jgi:DNA-binding response OmpR family regulator